MRLRRLGSRRDGGTVSLTQRRGSWEGTRLIQPRFAKSIEILSFVNKLQLRRAQGRVRGSERQVNLFEVETDRPLDRLTRSR